MCANTRKQQNTMRQILTTTLMAFALAFTACDAQETNQTLRMGEACPPGCECVCVDSGTGTDTDDSTSTSTTSPPTTDTGSILDVGGGETSTGGASEAWPSSEGMHTLPSGRRYRVRHPDGWDGVTPARALFAFHACSNTGASNQQYDSYRYAQNGGFMIVFPEAENGVCWRTDPAGVDYPFVAELIAEVESWPTVDASTRRVTGWSGGAFMSQSIACNLGADEMVVGSGGLRYIVGNNDLGDIPTSCVGPVEAYIHHGRSDLRVPATVGQEAVDLWASEMGCTNPTTTTLPLDWCAQPSVACGDPGDGCVSYTCSQGALTWCLDSSGSAPWYHSQTPGHAERDVGEILFND